MALSRQHGAVLVCHLRYEQHFHLWKLHQLNKEGAWEWPPHSCIDTDAPPEVTHLLSDAHKDLQPKSGLRSRLRPALGECASPRSLQGSGDAGRLQTEFALEPDLDDLGTSTMTPVGSIIFELSPRVRLVHIPERREEESQVGQKGSPNHLRIPSWAISKPPHLESFPCIKLFTLMLQFERITSRNMNNTVKN